MNNTIEIPAYAYKVTAFGCYDEACTARDIALNENEGWEAGSVESYDGNYIVRLWVAEANYYL